MVKFSPKFSRSCFAEQGKNVQEFDLYRSSKNAPFFCKLNRL